MSEREIRSKNEQFTHIALRKRGNEQITRLKKKTYKKRTKKIIFFNIF